MALSAAFRERLEHMERTRNQRLSLLQAEKEAQANKSQMFVMKLASMRATEQRCLAHDQKIASQGFKIWALRSEIDGLDEKYQSDSHQLRVLKSEVEELEELEKEKKRFYELKGFEMKEFKQNVFSSKTLISTNEKPFLWRTNYQMAEEVALDVEELRHLQSIAKRSRVINLISTEIRTLEKKMSQEAAASPALQIPTPISTDTATPTLHYTTLSSFSWDQDNDKVKIYRFLEGVDQEKIETDFKPMSFDIKFHDVKGKNYRFGLPKLNKEIDLEKCKVLVQPTRVVINLAKTSKDYWLDLKFKEDKLKPSLDKEKDPMAGIMALMKDEGDPDMKRTIAKAWTDAKFGQTG
ncbi:calcyclin-binding protein [Pyrus ussuriensis x Pyrus communis]|uniref:Calcyclin-binding protein n=1 Tax=Pyrus ussuriensis x Pyrus communis TaxID=2448454 RepID=A0A5N5FIB5_9ROSA|nr:calcyclin-binding protein [Pyrus ussuriensis x Pyrus communis]